MVRKKVENFFWPEITDLRTAKDAAWYGVGAAGFIAVLNGSIALITGLLGAVGAMGQSLDIFFDYLINFIIYVIITWGIYANSRIAAVAGLSYLILGWVISAATSGLREPRFMSMMVTLMLINSVRGTFAVHKFSLSQPEGTVGPDSSQK
jgi:hypothetical protein